MVAEPPGAQFPPPHRPPPVEDRRAPERRQYMRREEDRPDYVQTGLAAAMAVCGGLAIVFAFFWALGAVDIKNAVFSTVIAIVLALVWLAGYIYRRRASEQEYEYASKRDRERRGF